MSDELPTPNTPNSDANTTSVGGNVTTGRDFVGWDLTVHGDQVQGDKVAGDKISAGDRGVAAGQISDSTIVTGNNNIIGDGNTVITQRLDLKDTKNQRNHAVMRQLVRKFWIDGVLKSSLYNEVLIRLNLTEQPKAVDNRPWDLILQQPGQPNYEIPPGTPVIDVFDQMNGLMLILGEPGSGKTTTLLELADELLWRAESDPTYPTPVVFNLSSWAEKKQPLAEWLIVELRTKYNIPKKIAQQWIIYGELLLLLDGLDEVRQENREDCVKVINRFRQEYLVPMAVCSRSVEYEDLATGLRLQGAILVQPLTLAQIDEYLNTAGNELSAVRVALHEDTELQEMATTPLLLSVMAMAYHSVSTKDILYSDSLHSRRQHLFDAYIKRMFNHRGSKNFDPIRKTIHWLSWLAGNMQHHQQTIFLIERLQPSWLQSQRRFWRYRIGSAFLVGTLIGLLDIFHDPFIGLSSGLLFALTVIVIGRYEIDIAENLEFDWVRITKAGLLSGIPIALFAALLSGLRSGVITGIRDGLLFGISGGLFVGLIEGIRIGKITRTAYPNQGVWKSVRNTFIGGLTLGIPLGLVGGGLGGLHQYSFLTGVVAFGLYAGGIACIQHFVLRDLLWLYNLAPLNYARFLDHCHDRLLLRKVGGGYIFTHRMLMEHFARLADEDIKRLAAEVEASRS